MYAQGLEGAVKTLIFIVIIITIVISVGISVIVNLDYDQVVYEGHDPLKCETTITSTTKDVDGKTYIVMDTLYTYRLK